MDLDELRRIAEAATAGPWHLDKHSCYVWEPEEEMVADSGGADGLPDGAVARIRGVGDRLPIDANMAHIAAASPSAVLALLDRIEILEQGLHDLQDACMDIRKTDTGALLPLFQVFAHHYREGRDARFDGRPVESCMLPDSPRKDAWTAGWLDEDLLQNDAADD